MTIDLEKYRQKKAHPDTIATLRYSPSGKFLVTTDRSGKIILWQPERIRAARSVSSPYSTLTGAWFSEDEHWLLAGHQQGNIVVYSLPELKLLGQVTLNTNRSGTKNILSGATPVLDWVIFISAPAGDPDFYAVLEFCDFFTIRREGFQVLDHKHRDRNPLSISAGLPNGRTFFLGDELGYLMRSSIPEMTFKIFGEHRETVMAFDRNHRPTTMETAPGIAGLAISGDQLSLLSTSRSGGAQIWEAQASMLESEPGGRIASEHYQQPSFKKAPLETGWMRGACFLSNQGPVLLGTDDGKIIQWDYKSSSSTPWAQCSEGIRCIDAAPGGWQVAVGGENGSLFIVPLSEPPGLSSSDKPSSGWLRQLFGKQ
jgi:WD40 repeat protein